MIKKIDISGPNHKLEENFKKYAIKKIGKLDKYLPRANKKDVVAKIVVTELSHEKTKKYEISVAMEIPGGKVISSKDECTNLYAGIDIVEAKLAGQIRRFKLEQTPHLKKEKRGFRGLFRKN